MQLQARQHASLHPDCSMTMQVSASALSFTVQGITLSAADLVGFQPHVADAIPGLHHAFSSNIISSSAGSATRAASQQAAAASPPVQQSLAARVAGASQHALQLSMAAAHMPAEAADAARRQLLLSLTARRGSVVTALAVALGAALLLLLAVKLWRWVHRVSLLIQWQDVADAPSPCVREQTLLVLRFDAQHSPTMLAGTAAAGAGGAAGGSSSSAGDSEAAHAAGAGRVC